MAQMNHQHSFFRWQHRPRISARRQVWAPLGACPAAGAADPDPPSPRQGSNRASRWSANAYGGAVRFQVYDAQSLSQCQPRPTLMRWALKPWHPTQRGDGPSAEPPQPLLRPVAQRRGRQWSQPRVFFRSGRLTWSQRRLATSSQLMSLRERDDRGGRMARVWAGGVHGGRGVAAEGLGVWGTPDASQSLWQPRLAALQACLA